MASSVGKIKQKKENQTLKQDWGTITLGQRKKKKETSRASPSRTMEQEKRPNLRTMGYKKEMRYKLKSYKNYSMKL